MTFLYNKSLVGHHASCLSSMDQIDVKMFVVRAGWCPQRTNGHREVLLFISAHVFISKTNPEIPPM